MISLFLLSSMLFQLGIEVRPIASQHPKFLPGPFLSVTDGSKVFQQAASSKTWYERKFGASETPLLIDASGTLVTWHLSGQAYSPNRATERLSVGMPSLAGINGYPSLLSSTVTILADRPLDIPSVKPFDGVGISRDGKRAAWISVPMGTAAIKIFEQHETGWQQAPHEITPEIEGIGYCIIGKCLNEVVFLDSDHIAFLGSFALYADEVKLRTMRESVLDLSSYIVSSRGVNREECFLFVTSLRGWKTVVVAKLSYLTVGFGGELTFGNLGVTADQKRIVIPCKGSILVLNKANLLARARSRH